MTLLSGALQPQLLTLLSSTSSPSLSPIWRAHSDPALPSDSCISTLPDTALRPTSKWDQRADRTYVPKHVARGAILGNVVHLQSPNMRGTWIQAGCGIAEYRDRREKERAGKGKERSWDEGVMPLGAELGWLGMQIKRLGRREMSFEVGVVDSRGREGVVRCSSFKKTPSIHPYRSPPLIHLPLSLPQPGPSTLTSWSHISFNLATLLPLFQSLLRLSSDDSDAEDSDEDGEETQGPPKKRRKLVELPGGAFGSVSYVRVYANCRVRRIWLSADGERTLNSMGGGIKEEWDLYAAEAAP